MNSRISVRLPQWGRVLLLTVLLGSATTPLHAQTSFGTILGTVTDPSQSAVPDVSITVTNVQTGIERRAQTDSLGNYRVESLLPGIYRIKAEHEGFQVTEVADTQVQVAVTTTVNIVMQLGRVTQTVEVTGAAPQLQTASATVGTVVNNTSVVTLPLNGRNFTELVSMIPGSVSAGGAIFQIAGGANYSVSGNRAEQNNYTLDGAYNNEEMFKAYAIQPSIDAIQEFKIQTNITSAEYGQAAGSNVNVATKSGTNAIHGAVFEFLRNNNLDASDWFRNASTTLTQEQKENPQHKRNNYGFVAGGPVVIPRVYNGKDRSFWFFDYEATKVRRASSQTGRIPTAAHFNGDLTGQRPFYDPLTTCGQGTNPACTDINGPDGVPDGVIDSFDATRQQFPNNIIPTDRLDPWVQAYTDLFYPKISAPVGASVVETINSSPFMQDAYQWHIRADQKIRDNLQFFARFSLANATQTTVQSLPGLEDHLINNFRNSVASWTWVASPTTVVDLKVAYNRTNIQTAPTSPAPGWEAFLAANPISGTPVKSARTPLFPQLQDLTGVYSSAGQQAFPFVENQFQVITSLSKIWGKHSIKAGFEFLNFRSLDDGNFTSIFQFDTLPTADPQNVGGTGSALASLLLGLPSNGLRNLGETQFYARQIRVHPYLQDDIKVTQKLTLNIGLRWEYNQWPVERWDRIAGLDPTTGSYLWGGINPITGEPPNTRRAIRDPDFNNFAPRFGLAYQFTPQTTFRGGYSIFYTANYMWEDQGARGNWPYAISQTLSSINGPTTGPDTDNTGTGVNQLIGPVPITNFFTPDTLPGPDSVVSSQHVLGRTDRTTYAQQWNMGVQRMLTDTLLFEVNYVGSRTVKGSLFTNTNTAPPGPGVIGVDKHREFGDSYGAVSLMTNAASSSYNSMQVKVEKRFSNGLQFLNSYAWGHQLDIGASCFSCSVAPQNPYDWSADRANGNFDRRHVWTFSYYYQLPFGKGKQYMSNANSIVNGILGGWELSGIAHYNTGAPINVSYPGDVANIGPRALSQRPNWVGGQPHQLLDPNDRRLGYINMANYAPPDPFSFGNAGRNLERGPGLGYFNPALLKNFPLPREGMYVQFRAEFFNAFNQIALGGISSSFGASNFGTATSRQSGSVNREIQFGLKVIF